MAKGNSGIFVYNPNEQPLPLPKSDESYKGLQSWVESNNQLIYHLLIMSNISCIYNNFQNITY